jgi:hypothetical protein
MCPKKSFNAISKLIRVLRGIARYEDSQDFQARERQRPEQVLIYPTQYQSRGSR